MEHKQPKISVIIPAFNVENYIRQTIESVIDQTFPEGIEIIVVDDCSEDNTSEIINTIMRETETESGGNNTRILRFFRNENNLGVAKTRNLGVQYAEGEYIAFLDGDDCWEPLKLEKQMFRLLENPQAAFCFTGRKLIDLDGNSLNISIPTPEVVTYKDMLRTNYVTCSSVLMKHDVAVAYPMDHDEYCEDYICWMRILKDGRKALGINEPLVRYRMVNGSKSNDKKKASKDHYHSLRVLGYSPVCALLHMISYAYYGVKKYS